jgi:ATP-binding cassette subfamily F protein 3
MLDEPTNHLDIEAVQWLERTLREWSGAVLIVSHDRYFLDNSINTVWEMSSTGIEIFPGNYSAYLLQRDERWELTERVYKEEKARMLKEFDYIQRNRGSAQALGRLRRLTRDLAVADAYGVMALRSGKSWRELDLSVDHPLELVDALRKVNAISMPNTRPPKIHPRLSPTQQSGTIILRANHVSIGYPGHILFATQEVELRRCECVALIGPNGSGKTTFLKTLLGQLNPLKGEVQLGASLKIGYFSQVQDSLDPRRNVLQELNWHKEMDQGQARSHLAQYLFRGEDVFKPVSALSGGERARLALAILALEGANFLVLDEPTNHLDIPAQEALQEVLGQFDGTILLVSHDRYLIDRLATQIWELRDRKLNIFHGQYHEFVLRQAPSTTGEIRKILLAPKPLVHDNSKETRKRTLALTQLEERIRHQEGIVQQLFSQLQKDGSNQSFAHIDNLSRETARAQATLERLISNWEELAR